MISVKATSVAGEIQHFVLPMIWVKARARLSAGYAGPVRGPTTCGCFPGELGVRDRTGSYFLSDHTVPITSEREQPPRLAAWAKETSARQRSRHTAGPCETSKNRLSHRANGRLSKASAEQRRRGRRVEWPFTQEPPCKEPSPWIRGAEEKLSCGIPALCGLVAT